MPTRHRPLAVVTGASSGLGRGLATRFAARGYDLVLIARRAARLQAIARELGAEYQVGVRVLVGDLADPCVPEALVADIEAASDRVDVLVNCAGFGTADEFVDEDPARIAEEIAVDITAPTLLARLLLPALLRAPRGVLLNISSTASHQPLPTLAVYAAAKGYLTSLTAAIWQETRGSDLRVLALCPGPIATEFFEVAGTERFKVGRVATVEEVVDAAFRAIDRGDAPVVTVGLANRLMALAVRFVPRRLILAAGQRRIAGPEPVRVP
ncbi:SDR family NAD(P)-dependent oxidoreductase [Nocardia takedensis]|uniref:SDR family NAD(P)-dependent oxidoreductase n=1 Tax=Nocardia takedensis TaxID=259390 RepID=UPI0003026231|nr:SDR family NAD(P)-dependent oxidoreductase [Nocardia takedensis]